MDQRLFFLPHKGITFSHLFILNEMITGLSVSLLNLEVGISPSTCTHTCMHTHTLLETYMVPQTSMLKAKFLLSALISTLSRLKI